MWLSIIFIFLLLGAGEVCDTGFDVDEMVPCDSNGDMQSSSMIAPEVPQLRHRFFDRYQSVEAFNLRSLPNEMITALRFFEHEKSGKPSLNWGEVCWCSSHIFI